MTVVSWLGQSGIAPQLTDKSFGTAVPVIAKPVALVPIANPTVDVTLIGPLCQDFDTSTPAPITSPALPPKLVAPPLRLEIVEEFELID
jgi:hypothetical protein